MRNKIRSTLLILLTVFVVQISGAYHYKPSALITKRDTWHTACSNLERAISHLENLDSKAGDIEVSIDVNNEELRDALLAAPQHYSSNVIEAWASALSAAALIGYDIYDGIILHTALSNVAGAINTQMDKVGTESDSPEGSSYFAKRKKAYNDYVREINLYNAGHSGDDIGLPTQPETTYDVSRRTPPPPLPRVYYCEGGCGEICPKPTHITIPHGGTSVIYHDHRYRCEVDVPGLGNCPKTAYTCQTPQCENDANHLKKAPCGKHTVLESAFSQHEALPNGHARKGRCTYTHNFEGTRYQCIVMITHRCDLGHGNGLANQHDFNPDPSLVYPLIIDPEPEPIVPPNNNNNVTCSVCGVSYDPGSSSANDHALQASCSTDTNCISTSFYTCDNHTHEYPPTTVSCRRSACTGSVSSSDEHRVGPCSACGRSYWSCGPYAEWSENQHRFRTCRRSGCGNTWRRCQGNTPDCNASPGQGCWAQ